MANKLLSAIAKQIQGRQGAALGLPCGRISKAVADVMALVMYDRITKGPKLMPDSIVDKAQLDLKNPFCDWGLTTFEDADFSSFERTELVQAIKHLVALGYFWKMAASLPPGKEEYERGYKEGVNSVHSKHVAVSDGSRSTGWEAIQSQYTELRN